MLRGRGLAVSSGWDGTEDEERCECGDDDGQYDEKDSRLASAGGVFGVAFGRSHDSWMRDFGSLLPLWRAICSFFCEDAGA